MKVSTELIIAHFPCKKPYRFIEQIEEVNEQHIVANYRFKEDEWFFQGHFPGNPIVPGAILQEAAAQIGLVAFGMYLLGNGLETLSDLPIEIPEAFLSMDFPDMSSLDLDFKINHLFYLTSTKMDFKYVVRPKEQITVYAEKVFFRLNKLKCTVRIENEDKKLVSKGLLSGIVINSK